MRSKSTDVRTLGRQKKALGDKWLLPEPYWRPKTRSECRQIPRPCPFLGCKYHLQADVSREGGLKLYGPGVRHMLASTNCALDVAERGGVSDEDLAALFNVSPQAIAIIIKTAMDKLAQFLARDGRLLADVGINSRKHSAHPHGRDLVKS